MRQSPNRLYGNKKILFIESVGTADTCQVITPPEHILDMMESLNRYYDTMAMKVINRPSDFVNFALVKVIKVPASLRFESESYFSASLQAVCNIDYSDYDIVVASKDIAPTVGEHANYVQGKTVLMTTNTPSPENPGTLIHEIGHIFGCSDLYGDLGGRLQWRSTLYGLERKQAGYVYDLIARKEFDQIPDKAFAVCRGELRWTDLNNDRIVDVQE